MDISNYLDTCAQEPTDTLGRFDEGRAQVRSGTAREQWELFHRQAVELGFVSRHHGNGAEMPRGYYRITPRGWDHVNPRISGAEEATG